MTQTLQQPPQEKSRRQRRRRFLNRRFLLAGTAALLAALVGTEIFLRVYFGFARPLLYQADAACGFIVKPDQDIVRLRSHNFINHVSMRSPEFAEQPAPGTLRLLFVGDSVTYGTTYVTQDAIFPTRVAAELPAAVHQPVEVLNASAGGWGPGNEVAYLMSRGTYHANVVLMVWNTGDFGQPFAELPKEVSFPTQNPATAIGEVWTRYAKPRLFGGGVADPGSLPSDSPPEEVAIAKQNMEKLAEAKAFADKSGVRFGMVFVPSGAAFQTPAHSAMRDRFIAWTVQNHVPLFDMTGPFSHEDASALWFDGIHLKPHGNEIVVREIVTHWGEQFAGTGSTGEPKP